KASARLRTPGLRQRHAHTYADEPRPRRRVPRAGQALRQWPEYALAALSGSRRRHGQARLLTLELFELELQLPDLLVKLFRGAAKMHPPQPRDLQLQLLDLVLTRQRSEEHTSELQSRGHLVCRLL